MITEPDNSSEPRWPTHERVDSRVSAANAVARALDTFTAEPRVTEEE